VVIWGEVPDAISWLASPSSAAPASTRSLRENQTMAKLAR
jgi:hypothetical protein